MLRNIFKSQYDTPHQQRPEAQLVTRTALRQVERFEGENMKKSTTFAAQLAVAAVSTAAIAATAPAVAATTPSSPSPASLIRP